jgi:hypothetical protein
MQKQLTIILAAGILAAIAIAFAIIAFVPSLQQSTPLANTGKNLKLNLNENITLKSNT